MGDCGVSLEFIGSPGVRPPLGAGVLAGSRVRARSGCSSRGLRAPNAEVEAEFGSIAASVSGPPARPAGSSGNQFAVGSRLARPEPRSRRVELAVVVSERIGGLSRGLSLNHSPGFAWRGTWPQGAGSLPPSVGSGFWGGDGMLGLPQRWGRPLRPAVRRIVVCQVPAWARFSGLRRV